MTLFNNIMLAAAPLLPPEITAYNYKTIQEINPYCYCIEYSISGTEGQPVDFLTILEANNFTAIMYIKDNYAQSDNNYIILNDSNLYNFEQGYDMWISLAQLQEDSTNNYYSIDLQGDIDFSVVLQRQRVDNYDIGYHNGYKEGETSGYNNGYKVGYGVGYDNAVRDSNVGSYNWLTSAFNTLKNIFEVELLPGLKLGYLVGIPFVIMLVAFIISWFR